MSLLTDLFPLCIGRDLLRRLLLLLPTAGNRRETIVFSWIERPSKEVRDAANKEMMEDSEMKNMDMPFDGKRMIFGGFSVLFDTAPRE